MTDGDSDNVGTYRMLGGSTLRRRSSVTFSLLLLVFVMGQLYREGMYLSSFNRIGGATTSTADADADSGPILRLQMSNVLRKIAGPSHRSPPPAPPLSYLVGDQMRRRRCMVDVNDYVRGHQRPALEGRHPFPVAFTVGMPDRQQWPGMGHAPGPRSGVDGGGVGKGGGTVGPPEFYYIFFSIVSLDVPRKHLYLGITQQGPASATPYNVSGATSTGEIEQKAATATVSWTCAYEDGHSTRAKLIGRKPGDPAGTLLVLQCPVWDYLADRRVPEDTEQREPFSSSSSSVRPSLAEVRLLHHRPAKRGTETITSGDEEVVVWSNLTAHFDCWRRVEQDEVRTRASHGLPMPPRLAAATMLWGRQGYPRLAQWIGWHRMQGVQHFFVYLKEPWEVEAARWLPSAPYVTYRHWDVDAIPHKFLSKNNIAKDGDVQYFQGLQETHALYTARRWGCRRILDGSGGGGGGKDGASPADVEADESHASSAAVGDDGFVFIEWVATMDNDEFFVPLPRPGGGDVCSSAPGPDDLLCRLQPHRREVEAGNFSALEVKTQLWGASLNETVHRKQVEVGAWTEWNYPTMDNNDGESEKAVSSNLTKPRLVLDFTYKQRRIPGWWIPKTFSDPRNVLYYCIHLVTDGAPFVGFDSVGDDPTDLKKAPHGPRDVRRYMHRDFDPKVDVLNIHFRHPELGVGVGAHGVHLQVKDTEKDARFSERYLEQFVAALDELKYQ